MEQKYAWNAHDKLTEQPQLFLHLFYYNKIDFFHRQSQQQVGMRDGAEATAPAMLA